MDLLFIPPTVPATLSLSASTTHRQVHHPAPTQNNDVHDPPLAILGITQPTTTSPLKNTVPIPSKYLQPRVPPSQHNPHKSQGPISTQKSILSGRIKFPPDRIRALQVIILGPDKSPAMLF
ncbi:hypothetical protein BO99DRAFT_46397 [Aspergillus violaceofuscus CBS 115571]|uniref:Uncharacterized protein n=1 Tax=Aspergillus violaceofuscus (strain CBS 115571) TaxID=1450538 RepID=A0A2V5GXC1_ASPV1|nr:hypothetical protein BO99DRAFT_46397 [Aspergillus violaceofuscus CBS 115571]